MSLSTNKSSRFSRKQVATVVVVVAVLLSGCTATIETDVTADGNIEELSSEIEFEQFAYSALQSQAEEAGYDSVGEYLREDESEGEFNNDAWDSVNVEDDGEGTVTFTAQGGDPSQLEDIDVTVDEEADEVRFVDTATLDSGGEQMEGLEVAFTYTVNMPGEIIETNGEIQEDGSSVTWTNEEHGDLEQFEVTSDRSEANSDGSGPGFGVLSGLAALLVVAGTVLYRRQTGTGAE